MQQTQPRRILFVIARGDAFGGSSLHVQDMASRLEQDGHTVRVLVGGHPDMEVPQRFAKRNLNFVCIPQLGREISLLRDLRAAIAIRREFKKFQPDLVSLHSSKAGAVGRMALLGSSTPQLYTPHCWAFVDGFPKARIFRMLEKCLAPFSTRIIAVSEDERQFALKRGVGKSDQIVTIHNGVHNKGKTASVAKTAPSSPIRIIMVGRFEKQKNHKLLLRSLHPLRHLDWELTLVGEGPLLEECKKLAADLEIANRINFAGYSSQVADLLAHHDLFALISNWEGFPRSILEATSFGLPIIASDVGGCRESVIDGQNGVIVPPNDEETLSRRLKELISDPSQLTEMGRAGRDRYVRLFTFDSMYDRYARLYSELISLRMTAALPQGAEEKNPLPSLPHPAESPVHQES